MSNSAEIQPTPKYRILKYRLSSILFSLRSWTTQKAINLIVWLNRDSNYISHTKREVPEWFKEEGPNRWMADGTVELLAILSHQGHSGGSIGFAVQFFSAMAQFKPWGPLTGADSEWGDSLDNDGTQQNRRCSHVFRTKGRSGTYIDGIAYDINGKVFREPDGGCYTNKDSRVYIEFPYTPKIEYVDRPSS